MDSIDVGGAGVGKDGDEHMLLDIEGPRIERELPPAVPEEGAVGEGRGHEMAEGDDRDLS